MQTYPFSFTAQRGSTTIPAQGDLFVYESAENAGGELRVKVKPDNAGEITLRPGQRFRNPTRVTAWNITSYTGTEVVNGSFIIGEGEFDDANTLNTFKLDGQFANNVTVNNTDVNPVRVEFDPKKRLAMEDIVEYTGSVNVGQIASPGTSVTKIFDPVDNPNGTLVVCSSAVNNATMLAKISPPSGAFDGDVVPFQVLQTSGGYVAFPRTIKIPAGKGLYVWATQYASFSILFRKL